MRTRDKTSEARVSGNLPASCFVDNLGRGYHNSSATNSKLGRKRGSRSCTVLDSDDSFQSAKKGRFDESSDSEQEVNYDCDVETYQKANTERYQSMSVPFLNPPEKSKPSSS